MKKHAIIPIFVPHIGCSESCVFCDQKQITAREKAPTEAEVRDIVETWLSTLDPTETEVEISFYGGSFTAIPLKMQEHYLSIAKEYLDKGLASSLHLSTRPDCIDKEILGLLKEYGVKTIELGVQSFDDRVLSLSKRGHTAEEVYTACRLIKEEGFKLGIQLMIGLPGDSLESCIYSATEAVKLGPELARLYPCLVLEGTELMDMYHSGIYSPLSREEALKRTSAMYKILDDAGIYIMRVGLKSTDIISSENLGEINSGTYHPAFRQLVEGQIAREKIEEKIEKISSFNENMNNSMVRKDDAPAIVICAHPSWISAAAGHNGINREYFKRKYPGFNFFFKADSLLPEKEFRVEFASDYELKLK